MALGIFNPLEDYQGYSNSSLYNRLSNLQEDVQKRIYEQEMGAMRAQAREEAAQMKPVTPPEPNKVLLLLGENE